MRVRIVYDQDGTILSADWAIDGSRVGEFDLPEDVLSEVDDGGTQDEAIPLTSLPDEFLDHFQSVLPQIGEDAKRRRRARQMIRAIHFLRVDVGSDSLVRIDRGGSRHE